MGDRQDGALRSRSRAGGPSRRRGLLGTAAGLGVLGAGWIAQHRLAERGRHRAPRRDEDLVPAPDLRHHMIDTDDGGQLHVVERGEGMPLVLVHGFTLTSLTWVHQINDLAGRFRVLALDQRGHGDAEPGVDGFALPGAREQGRNPAVARLARDLETVLEALGVEGALVVGHSMGGMVALEWALGRRGDELERRAAGLVLTATTGGPFVGLPGWAKLATAGGLVSSRGVLLAERLGLSLAPGRDLPWWAARIAFGPAPAAAQVEFVQAMTSAVPTSTVAGLLGALAVFDVSRDLERVALPTLVVAGTHDRLTPPRHARALAAALPDAQLVELPRCGHMTMLERRFEFSRLLAEFADKVTADRGS